MQGTFVQSGDREIDEMRHDAVLHPTDVANFAHRIATMTAWVNLLQRQAADLAGYIPHFDAMTQARRNGDDSALFRATDAAIVYLNTLQAAHYGQHPVVIPGDEAAVSDTIPASEEWPVYGGDMHLTSGTDAPGPTQGTLAWKRAIGLAWYASPAVADGHVYIPVPGIRCMMRCVDLATGETIWQTRRQWTRDMLGIVNLPPSSYVVPGVASTPLLTDNAVIVNQLGAQGRDLGNKHILVIDRETGNIRRRIPAGEADYRIGYAPLAGDGDYVIYPTGTQRAQERPPQLIGQNRIVCQRADDESGTSLWDFHIGPTFCEPVVDGNEVFTANADGIVFCLRITGASGAQHFGFSDDRRVAWQYTAGSGVNVAPALTARHVVFGANDSTITCLDRATGQRIWQTTVPEHESHAFKLFSQPLIHKGRVYIGAATRRLYCLDEANGALLWSHEVDDWIRARPYIQDERVIVATMGSTIYAFDTDGHMQWQAQPGMHPVYADVVGAGGRILVTASDLRLFCLDIENGQLQWEHYLLDQAIVDGRRYQADELACGGWFQSKPTAADSRVYIGTPSRFVMAFDHATGVELWRYEVGGAVSAAPAVANGRVYFGQKGEEYFYCLDAQTGDLIWKQAVGFVWSSANIADGRVFVPGADGYVSCLDGETGHIIWRYRTGSSTAPEPPIDGQTVFFGSWDHYVYALDTATGRLKWQFYTGGSPDSGAPIAYQDRVYIPVGGNRLFCVDRHTGDVIWQHRIETGDMNASPALHRGYLYISMGVRPGAIPIASQIQCLDAADGRLIWTHEGGGITGPSVAGDGVYFASTSSPYFYCVDAANGTLRWRYEMGERVYESVPAIYGGRAYILNENGTLFAFE